MLIFGGSPLPVDVDPPSPPIGPAGVVPGAWPLFVGSVGGLFKAGLMS